ncbi:hypothetical protein HD553DRAFT_282828 [Filobasidium floriforme]|uniref:uncharacterized protein n=1 Tax=Filobasidium floriforme TaxID=5210 RepID=UPI001E8E2368|nr:uncharacterized protein HD553DRAFT_282828 [Filobasidium floriforme]KAH8086924.1 hypothetical protein HD553DRAFT_282828 [Filobasidium floriforme]
MATISFASAGPSRLANAVPRLLSRAVAFRSNMIAVRPIAQSSITVISANPAADMESSTSVQSSLRSLVDSLVELFPPFLLAVPKKKVSHSRKSMRSAHKGLKNKTNITLCPGCGAPKLSHNLCPECFSQINRRWKQEARQVGSSTAEATS